MFTSDSSTGNQGYSGRGKGRGYRGSRGKGKGKGNNVTFLAKAIQNLHALMVASEDYSHYAQEDLDDTSEAYDGLPEPPEPLSDPSAPDDTEQHSAQ